MVSKSVGRGATVSEAEEVVTKVTVDDRWRSDKEDVSMLERGGSSGSTSEKESTWAVGKETIPGEVLCNSLAGETMAGPQAVLVHILVASYLTAFISVGWTFCQELYWILVLGIMVPLLAARKACFLIRL